MLTTSTFASLALLPLASPAVQAQYGYGYNNRYNGWGTGRRAGVGVGAVALVLLVLLGVFCLCRRRRTQSRMIQGGAAPNPQMQNQYPPSQSYPQAEQGQNYVPTQACFPPHTMSSTPKKSPGSLLDITNGDVIGYAIPVIYLSTAPVAAFIAQTGLFSRAVPAFVSALGIKPDKSLALLGAVYFLVAYPISGGWSILGQTMGPTAQYNNKEPRSSQRLLTGLGRRLVSTHHNLMETFPAFVLAATMTQSHAPASAYLTNLLALHVLLKTTLFPLGYMLDLDLVRSNAHILSIGALAAAFWNLVKN
ncbi:hypothetical protein RQP46_007339 [Phenoliferia psychrophenolica]